MFHAPHPLIRRGRIQKDNVNSPIALICSRIMLSLTAVAVLLLAGCDPQSQDSVSSSTSGQVITPDSTLDASRSYRRNAVANPHRRPLHLSSSSPRPALLILLCQYLRGRLLRSPRNPRNPLRPRNLPMCAVVGRFFNQHRRVQS